MVERGPSGPQGPCKPIYPSASPLRVVPLQFPPAITPWAQTDKGTCLADTHDTRNAARPGIRDKTQDTLLPKTHVLKALHDRPAVKGLMSFLSPPHSPGPKQLPLEPHTPLSPGLRNPTYPRTSSSPTHSYEASQAPKGQPPSPTPFQSQIPLRGHSVGTEHTEGWKAAAQAPPTQMHTSTHRCTHTPSGGARSRAHTGALHPAPLVPPAQTPHPCAR